MTRDEALEAAARAWLAAEQHLQPESPAADAA